MSNTLRFAFAGTGTFAVPVLQSLLNIGKPTAVISQHKHSRDISPVATTAQENDLELFTPSHISEVTQILASIDLLIVADYGQILPTEALQAPRLGALNIHPSLLPRYRGPSPIQATIKNGDTKTGVTIIIMDEQMDHGPILAQTLYQLSGHETAPELEAVLAKIGAELLINSLFPYLNGAIIAHTQDDANATFTKLLTRSDGELDWTKSAIEIERFVRAYQPWPGIWFETMLRGKQCRIKIMSAMPWTNDVPLFPTGTLFWSNNQLGLVCVDGALELTSLQLEGGRKLAGNAFYRGYHDTIHTA